MNLNIKYGDLYTQTNKEVIKFRNLLRECLLSNDWRLVLKNLPNSNRIRLTESDLNSIQANPSINLPNFLTTRAITLRDLYEAFDKLNLENGLLLLGKQEQPIKIKLKSPQSEIIKVRNGGLIELFCQADGFPKPSYSFYNNHNEMVARTNSLSIQNANVSHNGTYKCVISQMRKDGQNFFENVFFKVQVIADVDENLSVKISPLSIVTEVEESIEIRAHVNESNYDKLKFEWFKTNPRTLETKFISNNPSSNKHILRIDEITTDDIGRYYCQVTRESTSEKIMSSTSCQVDINEKSEFDLKIALLIGNADYERDEHRYNECLMCKSDKSHKWLSHLDIYNSLERLKIAYEKLGYIVLAFVDMNADDCLRSVKLFKKICDQADRVSVLLHVIGHGHTYSHHDYLMPVDTRLKYHLNNHQYHGLLHEISISNLHNFLELFISDDRLEPNKQFYVVVFWDLCRSQWDHQVDVEPNLDIDSLLNSTMDYTVVYGCLTGNNEYFLTEELPNLKLTKGPIVTNLLLNNLKENLSLYEIAENINKKIVELREKVCYLKDLSTIKINSTLRKVNFWLKANRNKYFYKRIADEFFLSKVYMNEEFIFDDNRRQVVKISFSNDIFLNSILLNVEYDQDLVKDIKMKYLEPIVCKKIKYDGSNQRIYRLLNLLEIYSAFGHNLITILVELKNGQSKSIDTRIPEHFENLNKKLNSIDINDYIREKKMISLNRDDWSVSSVEIYQSDSQFETTSNDDS
ncbi:unnamed protein product [Brachionus calyciflorus]|uniref:Uncharacterized protein n=1 Tax=Brachionus calyciflorus TaxID=104777 RepID=A0A813ZA04_9BILA|nr:unnamed protein product [Brachionus calyciflorus]